MSFVFRPKRGASLTLPARNVTPIANALAFAMVLDDAEPPPFPAWPPAAISAERGEELLAHFDGGDSLASPATTAERGAYARFAKARDKWRATRSKARGKLPAYKLGSNDGWILAVPSAARSRQGFSACSTTTTCSSCSPMAATYPHLATNRPARCSRR